MKRNLTKRFVSFILIFTMMLGVFTFLPIGKTTVEGSTKITIEEDTFENTSDRENTIAAEFRINTPSDAVEFNGHYYKVYDISMKWDEAKVYCEELGGHLVTITSQEEQNFINTLIIGSSKKICG